MNEETEHESDEMDDEDEEEPRERASLIVISDFICPWCYIGHAEVDRLREEYDVEVHFAPFLLRPDVPAGGAPARRFVAPDAPPTPMELRGVNLGLEFRRGRQTTSYSHLALEAAEFANEYSDNPWRYHRRMFKAYFTDLEDIGQIETVVRVSAEAGLDAASLQQALKEGRYRERVDQGIEWSRSIGVTAIPTFVFNERFGMVGAQELDAFRSMMRKINQPPRQ